MHTATRVSIKPDGTDPDHSAVRPQISADGSLVAFVSQAFNLTPNAYTDADRVYAAVHFEITPEEQSVSGAAGGAATYDIVTQQHTPWWIDWNEWQPWTDFESAADGLRQRDAEDQGERGEPRSHAEDRNDQDLREERPLHAARRDSR